MCSSDDQFMIDGSMVDSWLWSDAHPLLLADVWLTGGWLLIACPAMAARRVCYLINEQQRPLWRSLRDKWSNVLQWDCSCSTLNSSLCSIITITISTHCNKVVTKLSYGMVDVKCHVQLAYGRCTYHTGTHAPRVVSADSQRTYSGVYLYTK